MNSITYSLKVDYSILIELCSYHSNQFGTHHSKEKLNNPQSPSLLSCSPVPGIPMNLLPVFTDLLIQDILYNCHQQYVVLWECFLFSGHIKFSSLDHVHKFRLSAPDTQGNVLLTHRALLSPKDLQALLLLFMLVPSLGRVHHTVMRQGHPESPVCLHVSHTSCHLQVPSHCTSDSHTQNNLTLCPLDTQYSPPSTHLG